MSKHTCEALFSSQVKGLTPEERTYLISVDADAAHKKDRGWYFMGGSKVRESLTYVFDTHWQNWLEPPAVIFQDMVWLKMKKPHNHFCTVCLTWRRTKGHHGTRNAYLCFCPISHNCFKPAGRSCCQGQFPYFTILLKVIQVCTKNAFNTWLFAST